ncbi:hypothetical protein EMGBS8_05940 [Verrucomicrobiota bacterium]|nr:hypothetical protein EMGBS8_05940 [Verrucomicrobiota bacterium]
MSPDPADSSRPPEDSIKPIDLSSLGFGPSWVDGPNENIGASRGPRREGGDRPSFRDGGNRGPGGPSRGPGGPRAVRVVASGWSFAVRVVLRVVPAVLVVLRAVHAMTVVVLVAMTAVIASNPNRPSRRWW